MWTVTSPSGVIVIEASGSNADALAARPTPSPRVNQSVIPTPVTALPFRKSRRFSSVVMARPPPRA